MAESCRRVLEIEVPEEVVKQRAAGIEAQFQRHAKLPGFRPGKAPLSIVRQRFRDDIRSELLRELVPEYVHAQAKEHQWNPVGSPTVTDIEFAENQPLKFKATLEVMPGFDLRDFSDLEIEVEDASVHEQEVEDALHHLQEDGVTYVNVDARPLQDGDYASIEMTHLSAAGVAAGKPSEVLVEVGGENTPKEFSENLRGASLGEERNFSVSYASDFHDPRVAGQTVAYRVKILGLKKKQVPELNDEFAKELGFDSLEAVRERIREDLRKSKQQESEEDAKNQLRHELAKLHDFPVPDSLVERQLEKRMEALQRQADARRLDAKQLDWGRMRTAQREGAVEDVKSTLILEKIADKNNLEVDRPDLESEIQKIAAATRQTAEIIEAHLTKNGGLDRMKSRLRIEKALEFVFQNVRRKSKVAPPRSKED